MSAALSFKHQRVQRLRRLLGRRRARALEGAFVVEGEKLVAAAFDRGAEIETLFLDVGAPRASHVDQLVDRAIRRGVRVFELAPGVLERVADTVSPQPVLAVVRTPQATLESLEAATFLVVCVDVRDPGNAGALVRVADAAGADGVVCCEGTVDPWNPKTVRASAGSVLGLPVVCGGDPVVVLEQLGHFGLRRLAAAPRGGTPHTEADLTSRVALVLGNEATGLAEHVRPSIDAVLTVVMTGRAESLNVATAGAVLCFEAARQRSNLHGHLPRPSGADGFEAVAAVEGA